MRGTALFPPLRGAFMHTFAYENGREPCTINQQLRLHSPYGGCVPSISSSGCTAAGHPQHMRVRSTAAGGVYLHCFMCMVLPAAIWHAHWDLGGRGGCLLTCCVHYIIYYCIM